MAAKIHVGRVFPPDGFEAPICQDGRSRGFTEWLARTEVCHDALIDLASEKAFETPDDVPFGPSIRPASDDIVNRRLVIAHTDHDGSMEGGVRLSVTASIEAMSARGHAGGGRNGARAAELGKGGFRANSVRVIPEDNQHRGGGVGASRPATWTALHPDTGLGQALRAVAGAMVTKIGTQVFWVQTGGYDTHAGQDTTNGRYADLLTTLDEALIAFRNDLTSHGLFDSTLVLQFSEFGRRVSENGSEGTDHGAAGLMMALGGRVAGGLYGTAASLVDTPDKPQQTPGCVPHPKTFGRACDPWWGAAPTPRPSC